jgi:hypothetical protein
MEELRLGNNEKILLDTVSDEDYKVKFKNKVVVTNQRCVFFIADEVHYVFKGIFPLGKSEDIKTEFRMEQEIKLNNIKETYAHLEKKLDNTKGNPLIFCIEFKLINGQKAIFPLFSYTKDLLIELGIPLPYGGQLELNVNLINDMYLVDRLVRYINQLIREIVKIECSYCGMLSDQNLTRCPNCNGFLK